MYLCKLHRYIYFMKLNWYVQEFNYIITKYLTYLDLLLTLLSRIMTFMVYHI